MGLLEHFIFIKSDRITADALSVEYQLDLVALSILVAVFASYFAFIVSERLHKEGSSRYYDPWLVLAALTLGSGIWAVHFVGMLAYRLPIIVNYDITITLISVIPSTLASFVVLNTHRGQQLSLANFFGRSVLMGAGIGTMHYTGMMAMRMNAVMLYGPVIFSLSIAIAIILAGISLRLRLWSRVVKKENFFYSPRLLLASVVMGLAITGMHYTGMMSMKVFPATGSLSIVPSWSPEALAKLVSGIVLTLGLLLLSSIEIRHRILLSARLRAVLNTVIDAVIAIDSRGVVQYMNPAAENMFKYRKEEMVGQNINILMPQPYHSGHDQYMKNFLEAGKEKAIGKSRVLEGQRKGGEIFPIQLAVGPVAGDEKQGFVGTVKDLSELRKQEGLLHSVFENLPNMVFVKDAEDLAFTHFNRAGEKLLGFSRDEMIGKSDFDLFPKEQAENFIAKDREALASNTSITIKEEPIETKSGERILSTKKIAIRDAAGVPRYLLGISEDITEQLYLEKELVRLATFDHLTSCANRNSLSEFLAKEINRAKRTGNKVACLFLDLDKFKPINDKYGHNAGDAVLVVIGKRLMEHARDTDCVARVGGDEFIVAFSDVSDRNHVERALSRITTAIQNPIPTAWGDLRVDVSVGLSFYPDDAENLDELIHKADKSMYDNKRKNS